MWRPRRCAGRVDRKAAKGNARCTPTEETEEVHKKDETTGSDGAGRGSAVPEDVYADRVCRSASGFSRGVLSLFELDADHPQARRRDDRALLGPAAAGAAGGAGRRGGNSVGQDLPPTDAEGSGGPVQRVC